MWDKGCCVLHTVAFVVCSDNEAMEDATQDKITTRDYEEIKKMHNHSKSCQVAIYPRSGLEISIPPPFRHDFLHNVYTNFRT